MPGLGAFCCFSVEKRSTRGGAEWAPQVWAWQSAALILSHCSLPSLPGRLLRTELEAFLSSR